MAILEAPPTKLPEPSDVKRTPVPSGISIDAAKEGAASVIGVIEGLFSRRKNGKSGENGQDGQGTASGSPAGVGS
jgi:hypothetical protein